MKLHAFVHNEWMALVVAQLVRLDAPVSAVVAVASMRRQWCNLAGNRALPLGSEGGPAPDAVLVGVGAPAADEQAHVSRIVLRVLTEDGVSVDDPLRWSVLNGHRQLVVALQNLPPAKVDVPGDYFAVAVAVAAAVRRMLDDVDLTEAGEPEPAPLGPVLSLDRRTLLIDWTAPAERVVRTVRAGQSHLTAAWTYLDGFPVSVGKARIWATVDQNVAPGTIVRSGDATIVQTGRGQVRVAAITDMIGPIQPIRLTPGMRFGIDPVEEIVALRGRVADLEQVVSWLTRERGREPVVAAVPAEP
jgi:hypothetical protein